MQFEIIVTGNVSPGFAREACYEALTHTYHWDTTSIQQVLNGQRKSILPGLEIDLARQHKQFLTSIGVECTIRPSVETETPAPDKAAHLSSIAESSTKPKVIENIKDNTEQNSKHVSKETPDIADNIFIAKSTKRKLSPWGKTWRSTIFLTTMVMLFVDLLTLGRLIQGWLSPQSSVHSSFSALAGIVMMILVFVPLLIFAFYYIYTQRASAALWIWVVATGGGYLASLLLGFVVAGILALVWKILENLHWQNRHLQALKFLAAFSVFPLLAAAFSNTPATGTSTASRNTSSTKYEKNAPQPDKNERPLVTHTEKGFAQARNLFGALHKLLLINYMENGEMSNDIKLLVHRYGSTLNMITRGQMLKAIKTGDLQLRVQGAHYDIAVRNSLERDKWRIYSADGDMRYSESLVQSTGDAPAWP